MRIGIVSVMTVLILALGIAAGLVIAPTPDPLMQQTIEGLEAQLMIEHVQRLAAEQHSRNVCARKRGAIPILRMRGHHASS